jgi:putative NADH-flavin reductase
MVSVLVIGASGRIGLVAVQSCLDRGHTVTAFLRSPSKIPDSVRAHANIRIVQGDARDRSALQSAIHGQDAVIQAAVYGSNSPWGTSDSEVVVGAVIQAANDVSTSRGTPLRLWVLSGQVLMDLPVHGCIEGAIFPVHPEHHANYKRLQDEGSALDWSLLCPGKVSEGKVRFYYSPSKADMVSYYTSSRKVHWCMPWTPCQSGTRPGWSAVFQSSARCSTSFTIFRRSSSHINLSAISLPIASGRVGSCAASGCASLKTSARSKSSASCYVFTTLFSPALYARICRVGSYLDSIIQLKLFLNVAHPLAL